MRLPSAEAPRDLIGWETKHGVVSVYVEIDPGDRGGAWRIELRDRLDEITAAAKQEGDRERRAAVEATVERVRDRFQSDAPPSGRMQIGFLEASPKPGREAREEWFAVQHPVERTRVVHSPRPYVRTLAEVLDGGRPRAIAALSAERVRLFEWRLGAIEELAARELELFALDWRERKAPQSRDPATSQAVGSAGRDQYGQRLEQNRRRFLKESGARSSGEPSEGARTELLCIGDPQLCEAFMDGWEPAPQRIAVDHHDVISEPTAAIGERATTKLAELEAERGLELVERATSAALASNGAGALGPSDTALALAQGRVERLLIDAEQEISTDGLEEEVRAQVEAVMPIPGGRLDEWIVEEAIRTSASITSLRDEPAERLAEHGGVAGLLRY